MEKKPPRTAIIVDDARFMRNLLRSMLEMVGYTVVAEAADGMEAVRKYREFNPDLALVDVRLPCASGLEVATEILAGDSKAKVVMCSLSKHDPAVHAAMAVGARGVITKPFKPEEVLTVIRRVAWS